MAHTRFLHVPRYCIDSRAQYFNSMLLSSDSESPLATRAHDILFEINNTDAQILLHVMPLIEHDLLVPTLLLCNIHFKNKNRKTKQITMLARSHLFIVSFFYMPTRARLTLMKGEDSEARSKAVVLLGKMFADPVL